MRILGAALAALLLSGCACTQTATDGSVSVEDVVRQVKLELKDYQVYQQKHASDAPLNNACGGKIDFNVDSVGLSLVTQTDDTNDANAGATVPVGAAGSLGPSLDLTQEVKQTQTTNITLYPSTPAAAVGHVLLLASPEALESSVEQQKGQSQFEGLPISAALQQLRESLLKASNTPWCYTFTPPKSTDPSKSKDQSNSIAFAFTIIRTVKGGATFKFLILSAGATLTRQSQAANTITVNFSAADKNGMGIE